MTITKDTVLKSGDSGEDVILLQQALVNNNFYPNIDADNNGVDGIYGPSTEDAVRRFQIVHELTVDGIAGPSTLSSLGLIDGNSGEISESTVLSPGNSGESVRVLQQALVDNNFYPDIDAENNGVDGIYGPNTEDAVRRYQIMHNLTVDGIAGPETLSNLGILDEGDGEGSAGYAGILQHGDSGEAVRMLQQALVDNNFYPEINAPNYGIDGIYGPNTEGAVRRYQNMNGLTVDGIAGPVTLTSLGISGEGSGSVRDSGSYGDTLRPGDKGDAVRALQQALVDNNFYPDIDAENNGVDGIYGPNTEDAVRRYQIMNGLRVDGIAGSETLTSLGLEARTSPEEEDDTGSVDFIGGDLGDISISQVFIPTLNYNRPGYSMFPRYITIHETANTAPGATAFMHSNYVQNPSTLSSWHFTVDDSRVIYQHLPTNESGFHAGDGSGDGNRNSIGIELCVNNGGDFVQTRRNAAVLVRKLMRDYNIPIYNVVTHNHWSGKLCPANMLEHFESFRTQVKRSTLPEPDPVEYHPINSPFADVDEGYTSSSKGTISYSSQYDVNLGPLKGSLTGSIIMGNISEVAWDLPADKAINGDLLDGTIDELINLMMEETLLPGVSEVAEARAEIDSIIEDDITNLIEARLSTFDISTSSSFPWIEVDWLTLEILSELSSGVHMKEKIVLEDVDWDKNKTKRTGLVFVLILVAAIWWQVGVAIATIVALLKHVARYAF
ncbi:peptidoglycan-binding protein [Alkalibacillus sp. S2W]|uniref:peptidoglycan recognition protein family protein n=1 Tax=Alkalibacillus sp. S2W TaxID=3386553 RepID=UPI00398C8F7C